MALAFFVCLNSNYCVIITLFGLVSIVIITVFLFFYSLQYQQHL